MPQRGCERLPRGLLRRLATGPWGALLVVTTAILSLVLQLPAAGALPAGWSTASYQVFTSSVGSTAVTRAVGVDADGNRYVAGSFGGSLAFAGGGTLSTSGTQVFVASLTPAGSFRWARRISSGFGSTVAGLAVTPSGNVVVHGTSNGATHINTVYADRVLPSYGQRDLYTAVFAGNDGHIIWAQSAGGAGTDEAGGVAVDGFGNIYVTGSFSQTATFGVGASTATLTSTYLGDAYVASYGGGGSVRFAANAARGGQESKGTGIVIASGAAFIIGRYTGAVTIGSTTMSSAKPGAFQGFIARMDPTTTAVGWVRSVRGLSSTDDGPMLGQITRGSDGALYVAGSFVDSVGYGPPGYPPVATLANPADTDVALMRIQPTGQLTWLRSLGASYYATPFGLASGTNGSVLVVGAFQGALALDGANLSTSTNDNVDGFLAEVGSNGTATRVADVGGPSGDGAYAVARSTGGAWLLGGDLGSEAVLPGGTAAAGSGAFCAEVVPS